MEPPNKQEDERLFRSQLTEYQVCQDAIGSNVLSFWTLCAIFIGVSSALLAGLIYGLLTSEYLFDYFAQGIGDQTYQHIWLLPIVVLVLGAGNVVILCSLLGWLKRVNYLSDRHYARMREIERYEIEHGRGMWKSWIIHGIDHYEELCPEEQALLSKYHDCSWWRNWKSEKEYDPPSRGRYFLRIFWTLLSLWILVIIGSFYLLCLVSSQ